MSFRERDAKSAEAAFTRALALDAKSSAAHAALGNLWLSQTNLQQAEGEFKQAAELSPVRSIHRLKYANFKIYNGEIEEGKRLLAELTKAAPDYVPAWVRQADVALGEKRYKDCASCVQQVLTRDAGDYEGLMLRGRLALAQGQATNAIVEFERLATLYERSPQVHFQLALARLLNNEGAKAIPALTRAVALDTNYSEAILLLAQLNLRRGDTASAITSLTRLIRQRPQKPEAPLLLARAYELAKKPEEAAAIYQRLMELFPESAQMPALLGMVLMEQNKLTEARRAFDKALELAPDSLAVVEQLANVDVAEKKYAAALERASKAQAKHPGSAGPLVLAANIHLAEATALMDQELARTPAGSRTNVTLASVPGARAAVNEAEKVLLKAVELDPNVQAPYLMLARIYVNSGRQQEALARLGALAAKTNSIAAVMQIASIQEQSGNFPAARDAYERALTLAPRSGLALNNLAYLYCERFDRLDRALELADKARQLAPDNPFAADTLGWVLYRKGDYKRAAGLITEAANGAPGNLEMQFHLGMVHYMLGEEAEARAALQRAVEAEGDFYWKAEGRRRLAILALDLAAVDAAALARLEKELAQQPSDPVIASRLAAGYERTGALEKAATLYEGVLKYNPQNAQALCRLAQLYATRLNHPVKALQYRQRGA